MLISQCVKVRRNRKKECVAVFTLKGEAEAEAEREGEGEEGEGAFCYLYPYPYSTVIFSSHPPLHSARPFPTSHLKKSNRYRLAFSLPLPLSLSPSFRSYINRGPFRSDGRPFHINKRFYLF